MSLEQVLAKLNDIQAQLNRIEGKMGGAGAPAAPAAVGGAVGAFQELVDQHLSNFASLSEKIGGDVVKLAPLVQKCVDEHFALIKKASEEKKPDAAGLQAALGPLSQAIGAVTEFQSKSRGKEKNNVFGIGEGIAIFGWVAVEPAPAPYAAEMVGSARFYLDKVLREFKGKDETQVAWAQAWIDFVNGLVAYIKKYHTTGLTWKK